MARRHRKSKITYSYKCSITDQKYVRTKKISNTEDLISIKAYYELHPENDDRPERIKKIIEIEEAAAEETLDDFFANATPDS